MTGRSNPVLPRQLQDRLEQIGLIQKDSEASVTRSSQAIDLKRKQVRNVVAFNIPSVPEPRKATLTVTVDFQPSDLDKRRVNVKFRACRVAVSKSPIDFTIPLGIIGPTGWLRTVYIDDQIRITRGHKGSVFVLSRPSRKQSTWHSKKFRQEDATTWIAKFHARNMDEFLKNSKHRLVVIDTRYTLRLSIAFTLLRLERSLVGIFTGRLKKMEISLMYLS